MELKRIHGEKQMLNRLVIGLIEDKREDNFLWHQGLFRDKYMERKGKEGLTSQQKRNLDSRVEMLKKPVTGSDVVMANKKSKKKVPIPIINRS